MNEMISVIVPVYNVEKYLDRCVISIVNQSYKNLEIILVDDGSTDKSGYICDLWANKDNRIHVIHKSNGGLSDARNKGLDIARGYYISFVDSDDWIDIDMLESLFNSLVANKASVSATGVKRVYENNRSRVSILCASKVLYGDSIIKAYLEQNQFSTAVWDKLFKKELFNNRRFYVGRLYEDAPVLYDILKNINVMSVVGKAQYNYFQRSDSICGGLFTLKKMDHYYFSKEIFEDVTKSYPSFHSEAKLFFGCKLLEIYYTLLESKNYASFVSLSKNLSKEVNKYINYVFWGDTVPRIIKIKALFFLIKMPKVFLFIRNIFNTKG